MMLDPHDCFLLCYETLKEAGNALNQFIDYFEKDPNPHILSFEIAEADIDVMYPYWVGVIFDTKDLSSIDDWMCRNYVSTPDFYSGRARYIEFKTLATTVQVVKCDRGKIAE